MEAWLCRAPLGRTMINEAAFSFTSCRSCSGVHEPVDRDYHHHDGDNDLFAFFTTTGGTKAKVSSRPTLSLLSPLYHSFCLTVISAGLENEVLVQLCPSCDPHSYDCIIHPPHSEDRK
jgi:hypothetical protein